MRPKHGRVSLLWHLVSKPTQGKSHATLAAMLISKPLRCLVCAFVLAVPALGCSSPDGGTQTVEPPNVVLIVFDALRADHLGCYGYDRNTSPNIDAFAASATRYARAISSAPWTLPSHASMFTGKPPFQHGAHTFPVEQRQRNANALSNDQVTLAEALQALGYRTTAFVANKAYLTPVWKLDQGFETFQLERVRADELNLHIFDWLEAAGPEPFFLFVNYMDTHSPYNSRPREGFLASPRKKGEGGLVKQLYEAVMPAKEPVPTDLVRRVIEQYDTAIANVDEQVGVFLDRLESMGLADNTLVVMTSDHGEYFGEHGLVEHSKDVYQEVLSIPLLIRHPGQQQGSTDDTLVVSNDLPHLIVSGLPEPARGHLLELFPDAPGNHLVIAENYYTRSKDLFNPEWGWRFQRVRRAVFDWPFKYIHSSDGNHELYDLSVDPTESLNLLEARPEIAKRLEQALVEFERERGRPQEAPDLSPLDEEQLRQLKALGYIRD